LRLQAMARLEQLRTAQGVALPPRLKSEIKRELHRLADGSLPMSPVPLSLSSVQIAMSSGHAELAFDARQQCGMALHQLFSAVAAMTRVAVQSGSDSVTTMHARLKGQVERKMAPVTGLFSLRIPEFESDRPSILNGHAVMVRQSPIRQRQQKSLPQLHIRHAAAQLRTISRAPFRPNRQNFPRQHRRISIPTDSAVRVRPPQPRSRSPPYHCPRP
jgi:hypothetical protein